MEVDLNAVEPKQHELKIVFDPVTKGVAIKYDIKEFGTWEYIIGILEMAKMQASFMRQQIMMQQAMQQQAAQQASRIFQGGR
jgi:hypothetical protein